MRILYIGGTAGNRNAAIIERRDIENHVAAIEVQGIQMHRRIPGSHPRYEPVPAAAIISDCSEHAAGDEHGITGPAHRVHFGIELRIDRCRIQSMSIGVQNRDDGIVGQGWVERLAEVFGVSLCQLCPPESHGQ